MKIITKSLLVPTYLKVEKFNTKYRGGSPSYVSPKQRITTLEFGYFGETKSHGKNSRKTSYEGLALAYISLASCSYFFYEPELLIYIQLNYFSKKVHKRPLTWTYHFDILFTHKLEKL